MSTKIGNEPAISAKSSIQGTISVVTGQGKIIVVSVHPSTISGGHNLTVGLDGDTITIITTFRYRRNNICGNQAIAIKSHVQITRCGQDNIENQQAEECC